MKGPYSHRYYKNKNRAILESGLHLEEFNKEVSKRIQFDMKAKEDLKSTTPLGYKKSRAM